MKNALLLLPFLLSLAACGRGEIPLPAEKIDGEYAWRQAEKQASVMPRHSGTPGAEQALKRIEEEARKLRGFQVRIDEFRDRTPEGTKVFRNLEAVLPGTCPDFILIGAHYDSKRLPGNPGFRAANDGASGVGILLAVMKAVEGLRPAVTLRFCFFDGEEALNGYSAEDGLHGSRHLARKLKENGEARKCRAMILADMAGDRDLLFRLPPETPGFLKQAVLRSAGKLGRPEAVLPDGPSMIDDHVPFQKIGIPAVDLIDFEYGPGNAWWHTGEDTMEKLSPESLRFSAQLILNTINEVVR